MGELIEKEKKTEYWVILIMGILSIVIYGMSKIDLSKIYDFYYKAITDSNNFFGSDINILLFMISILSLFVGIWIMLKGFLLFKKKEDDNLNGNITGGYYE